MLFNLKYYYVFYEHYFFGLGSEVSEKNGRKKGIYKKTLLSKITCQEFPNRNNKSV